MARIYGDIEEEERQGVRSALTEKVDPESSEKFRQKRDGQKARAKKKRENRKLTKKGKPRINSREKGNRYEVPKGDEFAVWQGLPPKSEQVPVKGKPGKMRTKITREWFQRSPGSGGWSRRHAPGDILVPPGWWFLVEFKNREADSEGRGSSHFDQIIKGTKADTREVMLWWREAWDALEDAMSQGNPLRDVMMVFTRNLQPDWVMLRLEALDELETRGGKMPGRSMIFRQPGIRFGAKPDDPRDEPVVVFLLEDLFKMDPALFRAGKE